LLSSVVPPPTFGWTSSFSPASIGPFSPTVQPINQRLMANFSSKSLIVLHEQNLIFQFVKRPSFLEQWSFKCEPGLWAWCIREQCSQLFCSSLDIFELWRRDGDRKLAFWAQFHQRSMYSFYARRSRKRKKIQVSHQYLFTLLVSACVKASGRTLIKLTPDAVKLTVQILKFCWKTFFSFFVDSNIFHFNGFLKCIWSEEDRPKCR